MLPKPPPRGPRTGFIYEPPYRIQGESVAGEHTVVQIPELGLNFDMPLIVVNNAKNELSRALVELL